MRDAELVAIMRSCVRTLEKSGSYATVIICVNEDGEANLTSSVERDLYVSLLKHILDPSNITQSGTAPADGDA